MAHNPAYIVALAVSAVVHLSTVTLFSIVVHFPKRDVQYMTFEVREIARVQRDNVLTLPTAENPFATEEASSFAEATGTENSVLTLPEVQLPSLPFDEFRALALGEQGLRVARESEDVFAQRPKDAWARIGEGVGQLRGALSRLTTGTEEKAAPILVSRPGNGFEIYVLWASPPYDRGVLWAQPIEALHTADAADFERPLALQFQVNAEGRVTLVPTPIGADEALTENVALALLDYRFLPVSTDGIQLGTLLIRAEGAAP